MSNKRKIIRDAFVNFLKAKTPALDRVYSARVRTISEQEMPSIIVRDGEEKADVFNKSPRRYLRSLDIVIEIYCKTKLDIHDDLTAMMMTIEQAIDQEDRFTPLDIHVAEIFYEGSTINVEPGDKTQTAGVGLLRYRVEYFTDAGALDTDLTDHEEIFADINGAQTILEIEQ